MDLVLLLAYARIEQLTLNISSWPKHYGSSRMLDFRSKDTALEIVKNYIRFPPDIRFDATCEHVFKPYIGGGASLGGFYESYLSSKCSQKHFERCVSDAAKDFSFCDEILNFLAKLPSRLVGIHVRRSDKFQVGVDDGTVMPTSKLDRINELTYRAIDRFRDASFFVCGDEDSKADVFREYARSRGQLITIPSMPKHEASFYDLAVLSRCDPVLVSHTGSNFSRFASMIGGHTFASVTALPSNL
jgi:hypothetical protein